MLSIPSIFENIELFISSKLISLFELIDTEYYKQILKDEYYGNADQ